MGFDLKIPKQLQDELRKVPHLRLLVPAAAAVVWVFGKIIRPGKERHAITAGDEEEVNDPAWRCLNSRLFLAPRTAPTAQRL